jgi:hypothetical protein
MPGVGMSAVSRIACAESWCGRVPSYLYFNPDYVHLIGGNVGLIHTTGALSDFTGRLLERVSFATD